MTDYNHDLAELQDLLQRADVLKRWTRGQAFRTKHGTRVEFKAELAIRQDAHVRPPGTLFDVAEVELNYETCGDSLIDISDCCAQIVIDGLANDGATERRFALHFDRQPDNERGTELHATYHWHVGGNRFDGWSLGNVLMLDGPRFPSYPVDPVLLIDFVLGHFHGVKRRELMSEKFARYRRLLHRSQERLIVPFFRSIVKALDAEQFEETNLWPWLCGRAER